MDQLEVLSLLNMVNGDDCDTGISFNVICVHTTLQEYKEIDHGQASAIFTKVVTKVVTNVVTNVVTKVVTNAVTNGTASRQAPSLPAAQRPRPVSDTLQEDSVGSTSLARSGTCSS